MRKYKMISRSPQVFLDLDGVQADFSGAVEKIIGMKRAEAKQKTLDEIERLSNSSSETVRDFFANLDFLPAGQKIVEWLNKNKIPYTILSAPLRGPYANASIEGKKIWLNKHTPGAASTALFKHDKHEHAVTNGIANVLIDDYYKKIDAWNNAGGIGILHLDEFEHPDSAERTINQLKQVFNL